MEKIKRVKASQIPDATNIDGFKAFGIKVNTDGTIDNVKVSMDLLTRSVPALSARIDERGHLMVVTNEEYL